MLAGLVVCARRSARPSACGAPWCILRDMLTQPPAADIPTIRRLSQVALDLAERFPANARGGRGRKSDATEIGERLGVSRSAIGRARVVLSSGDAVMIEQVRAGRLTVFAAAKRLRPVVRRPRKNLG
jgi:hypothetical protein